MRNIFNKLKRDENVRQQVEILKAQNQSYRDGMESMLSNLRMIKSTLMMISNTAHTCQEQYDEQYKDTDKWDGEVHNKFVILWGQADIMLNYFDKLFNGEV